jgi:ferritin-like metal-binding protein YciE
MSENLNTIQVVRQVAVGQQEAPQSPSDANEIQQLSMMIKSWRENQKEVEELNQQLKEKKKRSKVMEEVILRIMKKNNIGALDLQSSGGRLLYRRQTSKAGLGQKDMARLLTEHLKSEQAANTALQYIAEHRGTKVKESLLYEKD